jgi:hypothetical protein
MSFTDVLKKAAALYRHSLESQGYQGGRSVVVFALVLLVLAMGATRASAQCTPDTTPVITGVAHQPGSTAVTIVWNYGADTFCVWPPDFYQVRWTAGDGPATGNQSPQINSDQASASWVLTGIDPSSVYGFIVQACATRFLAPSNCTQWSPMAYYKPYGPLNCRTGYLWRNAFSGDKVCVTPTQQGQAEAENAAGPGLIKTDGFCDPGYVWRQAIPTDHVCVTPSERSDATNENAAAPSHTLPPP